MYLARVENFTQGVDPRTIGFDAAVEFAPDMCDVGRLKFRGGIYDLLAKIGLLSTTYRDHNIVNYQAMVEGMLRRTPPDFARFHCVTPSWDNSPRRKSNAWIYNGSTPEKYGAWLRTTIQKTLKTRQGDERIVFINAWNEWAEGNHLEPDLKDPDTVYAGVEDAALFRSSDGGQTWDETMWSSAPDANRFVGSAAVMDDCITAYFALKSRIGTKNCWMYWMNAINMPSVAHPASTPLPPPYWLTMPRTSAGLSMPKVSTRRPAAWAHQKSA